MLNNIFCVTAISSISVSQSILPFFQIITLLHTLFRYEETGVKTVLVITPNATIENWCKEFHKWLDNIPEKNNFLIFNFAE